MSVDRSRGRLVSLLLILALWAAACGTRLPHDEIVASNTEGIRAQLEGGTNQLAAPTDAGAIDAGNSVATSTTLASNGLTSATSPGQSPGAPTAAGSSATPQADNRLPTGPATLSPITLANIGHYTGVLGAILVTGQQSLQVWAAWANEHGGLGGHRINLLTGDDGGDPTRARALLEDFVKNKGAVAIIAPFSLLTANVLQGFAQSNHIPVIGGDLLDQVYETTPEIFPHGGNFREVTWGTVQYAMEANGLSNAKVGSIVCVEVAAVCAASQTHIDSGAPVVGYQQVYEAKASLAQPDFTTECVQARDRGVQILFLGMDGNSTRRVADSCAQQDYHPILITNTLGLVNEVLGSPNVDGLVATSSVFPAAAADTPATREFRQAYRDFAGQDPSGGAAALSWSAGKLLQIALRNAPKGNVTTQDVFEGMWTIKNETVGGLTPPLTFTKGRLPDRVNCYFTSAVSGNRFTAPLGSELRCIDG